MDVRQAAPADEPAIRALWEAFNAEVVEVKDRALEALDEGVEIGGARGAGAGLR